MHYSELSDYDMLAGSVTIWRAGAHAEAAKPDARPLAPQHERHIAAHVPGRSSDWIGVAFEIHEAYDPVAVRSALWLWHKRHETLRTTARRDEGGWARLLIDADAVQISADPATEFGTGTEVGAHLQRCFDDSIYPHDWPHFAAATVVPRLLPFEPPHFQMVLAADHAVVDAYSLLVAVTELQQLYAHAHGGAAHQGEAPAVPSYIDFSALESEFARRHSDSATLERWRRFLGPERRFPSFPLDTGDMPATDRGRQRSFCGRLLRADEVRRVHAAGREQGYGMQNTVLCALSEAARRSTDLRELRFVMLMHTRTAAYEHSVGWFVGLSPVTIPLAIEPRSGRSHHGILRDRCTAAVLHARADAELPFTVTEERLGVQDDPRFVVSYVDVRHVPGGDRFDAVRACWLRRPVSGADEVYLWLTRGHSGLNVSVRLPDSERATAEFTRYLAVAREVLLELADGELTEGELAPVSAAEPDELQCA